VRLKSIVSAGLLALTLAACSTQEQPSRNAFSEPLTLIAPAIAPFPE